MGAETGIEVTGATRAFGSVQAVDHIDLQARPGEVTALVGPNGAGKTTLLLMLATLLAPDAGTIRIAGLDPVAEPRQVRAAIGWMPDAFGTWDALTVREVLETVGAAYRMAPGLARTRAAELLDLVHLGDLADRPARVLSRGQKQRLGLARALVHHPSVLLLDEPASGLDPRSRIELRDILRQLAASGATLLVSSHILTELQEIADRAVIVARGRSVAVQDLTSGSGTDSGSGSESGQRVSHWRITSLDPPRLMAALAHHGVATLPLTDAVDVEVAGDIAASELLAQLVGDGIPITSFAPSYGALETAYLAATEDRQ
jgi:ABC-2 type transport system ATP-binding protein